MTPLARPNGRAEVTGNYTADGTEAIIAITGLALSLTVTLPDPSTVGPTSGVVIKDESGLLTALLTVTIVAAGGATLDGAASLVLVLAFGKATVYSTGKAWFTR